MSLSKLDRLRADMEKCFRCSLCKMTPLPVVRDPRFSDACPASRFFHFHGYSGSGKQIMALSLLDGRTRPDPAMAHVVFACTCCGYCDVACKFIMDAERHQVNMALREHLVEEGLAPAVHRACAENLERHGHPAGAPGASPGAWATGLNLKAVPGERAQVLLFAGCSTRTDPRAARTARKLARLLLHAGVDVGTLGDREPCCGLPAYWRGFGELFARTARRATAALDAAEVGTIVVASGSCTGTIRARYGELGVLPRAKVRHASEFLAGLIDVGCLRLPRPVRLRVAYHDPCQLGRQGEPFVPWTGEEKTALGCMTYTEPPRPVRRGTRGVYDAPRRLLASIRGLELRELYRIREYALCCGAGGGAPDTVPDMARATARDRIEEARAVGAEALVSACTLCESHLTDAQPEGPGGPEVLPVVDLVDLVYEAAGLPPEEGEAPE